MSTYLHACAWEKINLARISNLFPQPLTSAHNGVSETGEYVFIIHRLLSLLSENWSLFQIKKRFRRMLTLLCANSAFGCFILVREDETVLCIIL